LQKQKNAGYGLASPKVQGCKTECITLTQAKNCYSKSTSIVIIFREQFSLSSMVQICKIRFWQFWKNDRFINRKRCQQPIVTDIILKKMKTFIMFMIRKCLLLLYS